MASFLQRVLQRQKREDVPMALPHLTPRQLAPHLVRGAYGVHILLRMWRLSKLPPSKAPLHLFLLQNTDVILAFTSAPVVWRVAQRQYRRRISMDRGESGSQSSLVHDVAHRLRQVFTVLLLGLGIIKRRAARNRSIDILRLVNRLQQVIADGIQAVNMLDPPSTFNNGEREEERGA
jgi:hypothetical protein